MRASPRDSRHAIAGVSVVDTITICLDAMSGDRGPGVVVDAAATALAAHPNIDILFVGDEEELARLAGAAGLDPARYSIRHTDEIVTMEDSARDAIRRKKNSSMRVAIDAVKDGVASACVSAGNTGALMATAKFVLKTIAGIDRPAIISEIPAYRGRVLFLDLGANPDCSPEQLFQFAVMGSVVARDLTGVRRPRVGLLNIGVENTKGDNTVREAATLLADAESINYVGFVEGGDIFNGVADVVVTDGFTGNVALKTMEGTAGLIAKNLKEGFSRNLLTRLQALIASPVLKSLQANLDPRHYNGATFVGLNGIVIKSHGSADAFAFKHAIDTAVLEVETGMSLHIGQQMDRQ